MLYPAELPGLNACSDPSGARERAGGHKLMIRTAASFQGRSAASNMKSASTHPASLHAGPFALAAAVRRGRFLAAGAFFWRRCATARTSDMPIAIVAA